MSVGSLEFVEEIKKEDLQILEAGLAAHAIANGVEPHQPMPLAILKRDANGIVCAGVTGQTVWGWLYIDTLWVHENMRKRGIASALMNAVEEEARKRGCCMSFLWTQSFEGKDIYPKFGYKEFVVWDDVPVGHQRIGFMKRIAS